MIPKEYIIQEDGKIWSSKTKRFLKAQKDEKGYLRLRMTIEKQKRSFRIHRLVAFKYIPNPNNYPQVNHIDGNKENNHVSNLEWCDNNHNHKHAIDNGLWQPCKGEKNGASLLTEFKVLEIRSKFKPYKYTRKMLAEEYGISEATVKDVVSRKSWKHI